MDSSKSVARPQNAFVTQSVSLKNEKASLQESLEKLDEQRLQVEKDLHRVTKQLEDIELHELSPNEIQFLERRLMRLKDEVERATECQASEKIEMQKEPRVDDEHNPLVDEVPWSIEDYELLDMSEHIDITLKIYSPAIAKFVSDWIAKNVEKLNSLNEYENT